MVLDVAMVDVKTGQNEAFEAAFQQASPLIAAHYQEWKRLLHHFYDPFPTVEHYVAVTLPPTAPSPMPNA